MFDFFSSLPNSLTIVAPALPPDAWWMVGIVIFILGIAAAIDAFTGMVPDPLIFLGMVTSVAVQGAYASWPDAAHNLMWALGAAFAIWALNEIWFKLCKKDALGMGDAKWTMLAVACFGLMPAMYAWGLGACLAIVWMGILRFSPMRPRHVHFAPFLFVGLMAALWWLRLRQA
jgi:prepilin signal peptidase PulO-like enzyme (type II secretory pathway)